ncbi:unnamed protein product [Urochloa humidicola]
MPERHQGLRRPANDDREEGKKQAVQEEPGAAKGKTGRAARKLRRADVVAATRTPPYRELADDHKDEDVEQKLPRMKTPGRGP